MNSGDLWCTGWRFLRLSTSSPPSTLELQSRFMVKERKGHETTESEHVGNITGWARCDVRLWLERSVNTPRGHGVTAQQTITWESPLYLQVHQGHTHLQITSGNRAKTKSETKCFLLLAWQHSLTTRCAFSNRLSGKRKPGRGASSSVNIHVTIVIGPQWSHDHQTKRRAADYCCF